MVPRGTAIRRSPSTPLVLLACLHAGHNVPVDLCPPGAGCAIAYQIMSYWYLAQPRDASAEVPKLPWLDNNIIMIISYYGGS